MKPFETETLIRLIPLDYVIVAHRFVVSEDQSVGAEAQLVGNTTVVMLYEGCCCRFERSAWPDSTGADFDDGKVPMCARITVVVWTAL